MVYGQSGCKLRLVELRLRLLQTWLYCTGPNGSEAHRDAAQLDDQVVEALASLTQPAQYGRQVCAAAPQHT